MKQVLKFSASWCGPCQALSMTLKGIDDIPVEIKEIDIDENLDLAAQYNIRSVPTLVMLENGSEVKRVSGALPANKVKEFLNG
jgi:thioredoxin-like negative regulator of GroEL